MTDFYTRLEEQLVTAGRGRSARGVARRTLAGRRPQLVAVTALIVAAILAVSLLPPVLSSYGGGPSTPAPTPQTTPVNPLNLKGVTVSVLNATTTPGVARAAAQHLQSLRAGIVEIGDSVNQTADHSVVRFKAGAHRKAQSIAFALGIERIAKADMESDLSRADVVVFIGGDGWLPTNVDRVRVYTKAGITKLVAVRVSGMRDVRCVPPAQRGLILFTCTGDRARRPWTCQAALSRDYPDRGINIQCEPARR